MARSPSKRSPEWSRLEDEVGSIYRSLGYQVSRDVQVGGKQVDVLVEASFGGGITNTILVEVKHTKNQSLPVSEVREFFGDATRLLQYGLITSAILVSNRRLTQSGIDTLAADGRTTWKLVDDLRSQLAVDYERSRSWVTTYKSRAISDHFIDLRLSGGKKSQLLKGERSALKVLEEFVASPSASCLVLLADYGAGKTTLLERLKANMLDQFLGTSHDDAGLPIMLELRNLLRAGSVAEFLRTELQREVGLASSFEEFMKLPEAGRAVFLLDGFDEIEVQPNASRRAELVGMLSPILFGENKAILTSRPSYFATPAEYRRLFEGRSPDSTFETDLGARAEATSLASQLLDKRSTSRGQLVAKPWDAEVLRIDPLNIDQVRQFITAQEPELASKGIGSAQDILNFFERVYDLSDLITRPILLQMIIETVIEGGVNIHTEDQRLGPSDLYAAYCSVRLRDDQIKAPARRQGLSTAQRLEFARLAAGQMRRQGAPYSLAPTGAKELARQVLTNAKHGYRPKEEAVERALTDLRTCSFLTVDIDGQYKFIHKSFYEYFVALLARESLLNGTDYNPLTFDIEEEVAYFLGSMAVSDRGLKDSMIDFLQKSNRPQDEGKGRDSKIRTTILTSLFHGGEETHTSLRVSGARVGAVRRARLEFDECELEQIDFDELAVDLLRLSSTSATNLEIEGSVERLEIARSSIGAMRASVSEIQVRGSSGVELSVQGHPATIEVEDSVAVSLASREAAEVEVRWSEADLRESRVSHLSTHSSIVRTSPVDKQLTVSNSLVVMGLRNRHTHLDVKLRDGLLVLPCSQSLDLLEIERSGGAVLGGFLEDEPPSWLATDEVDWVFPAVVSGSESEYFGRLQDIEAEMMMPYASLPPRSSITALLDAIEPGLSGLLPNSSP